MPGKQARVSRSRRRGPPWWFMPLVFAGMGIAAVLLAAVLLHGHLLIG